MKVRVLRVLEYVFEGPADTVQEQVEKHFSQRFVKGTIRIPFGTQNNNLIIREAIVGDWPEILEHEEHEDGQEN